VPDLSLDRGSLHNYLEVLARAVESAGVGGLYPDGERVAAHLRAMRSQSVHRSSPFPITISRRTGLPTFLAWSNVATGTAAIPLKLKLLGDVSLERALERTDATQDGLRQAHGILSDLETASASLAPIDQLSVELVRRDAKGVVLRLVCDRITEPETVQRTTVELEQKSGWFKKEHARFDDSSGEWRLSNPALRKLMMGHANLPLRMLIVALEKELGAGVISSVSRGTLGPAWLKGVDALDWLKAVPAEDAATLRALVDHGDELALTATLDRYVRTSKPEVYRLYGPVEMAVDMAVAGAGFSMHGERYVVATGELADAIEQATSGCGRMVIVKKLWL
jgi:hypothetical protein